MMMLFQLFFLIRTTSGLKNQEIKIIKTNFSDITNYKSLLSCTYQNNANAQRYTNSCARVLNNTWTGIHPSSVSHLGGAIWTKAITASVEMLRNRFIRCKAKSGGACAISVHSIQFRDNVIDSCVNTDSYGTTDGAVYFFSTDHSPLISFFGTSNRYNDCRFHRGGGFESTCTNAHISLSQDTYTRCRAGSFGGGVHINNLRGANSIEECTFTDCRADIGGAIGYDCPETRTMFFLKIMGCTIENGIANRGMAIFCYYKSNSFFNLSVSGSTNRRTIIRSCRGGSEVMYVQAHFMNLSSIDIQDTTGNVVNVNQQLDDYKIDVLNLTDCSFTRCMASNNDDGIIIFGRFGNLTVENCRFEEISTMWNFSVIENFRVYNSRFDRVNDASSTRLVTSYPRFTFIYESCVFVNSTMSVRITTNINTVNMQTKIINCLFEKLQNKMEVSIPTDIEVRRCRIDGNSFRFSSASRSLAIRDCTIIINNDPSITSIIVDSLPRTTYSEVRNCTFNINAGHAIAVNGLVTETNMKFINCQFLGNTASPYISLRGGFMFEGNTFRAPSSKTTPVIRFMGGRLNFSRTNLNCIPKSFRDTFIVDDQRFYDDIIDSEGNKIMLWGVKNNLCLEESTFLFTRTQNFIPTAQFVASMQFSNSHKFTSSISFSQSAKFTRSSVFSASKQMTKSMQFSKSAQMTKSSMFTRTDIFSQTLVMSKSLKFSGSKEMSRSDQFSRSLNMPKTGIFSASKKFTRSHKFDKTIIFSRTKDMTESNQFTKSSEFKKTVHFSYSRHFSQSEKMTKSSQFSNTAQMSNSFQFSRSSLMTKSSIFTRSHHFKASSKMSSSNGFTSSSQFTPSDHWGQSHHFTPSSKFTASNNPSASHWFSKTNPMSSSKAFSHSSHFIESHAFSASKHFSLSSMMSKSKMFSGSIKFIETDQFTPSDHWDQSHRFTPSSKFTRSGFFQMSRLFTRSNELTRSDKFSKTEHFTKSVFRTYGFTPSVKMTKSEQFSMTAVFTKTGIFTNTRTMTNSKHFSKSKHFMKSSEFTKSFEFSLTSDFTGSSSFSESLLFDHSNVFTDSNAFTASKTISFPFEGQQNGPEANVKKPENSSNAGILAAIVIGLVLAALAVTFLMVFLTGRKKEDIDEYDGDIETNDGSSLSPNQTSTMMNPLYDGDTEGEADPFEFDFAEGENVFHGGMNL